MGSPAKPACAWRSLHVLAAVDVDFRAVDVRRRLRAQHIDDLRHFVGRAEPMHRDHLDDLLGAGRKHRGIDLARRDGVDPHADRAEIHINGGQHV